MPAPLSHDMVSSLQTGLALLDADWRVLWLNNALAESLHMGARSLRGQSITTVFEDEDLVSSARRTLAGGDALCLRDVALASLRDEPLRADIHLQILDDRRVLLEVHMLAATVVAPTPLSATLRGFAHEVKNPLAGLRGAAQLLQRRLPDTELQSLCDVLLAETDRLTLLADRLLNQRDAVTLAEVNLHEILERISTLLVGEAPSLCVRHDYDPSLPALRGDADRLQQLLLNVARNALDAGASELVMRTRVQHALRLGDQVVGTAVRVDLADNGPGIDPSLRDTLFEPLVSGHPGGTGLGLALAREIAHEHGGELRCISHPGATVFSLYLPLEANHA